jgi:hypothetical protein
LHICVLGNYLQEHSIKGHHLLKPEIQRLATSISFLHFSLETTWKNFSLSDVELGILGIKTSIRDFINFFSTFYAKLKPKMNSATVYDKNILGIK